MDSRRRGQRGSDDGRRCGEWPAASRRCVAVTEEFLAFSRKQVLTPRPTDVNELIRDNEPTLKRLLGGDLLLITRLHAQEPVAYVDPTHLAQVVIDLVVNARDAMPGGGTLTIRTHDIAPDPVRQRKAAIGIAISDTGGSTFAIRLPLWSRDQTTAFVAPSTASRSILVVEDDASVRALTTRILQRSGYKVTCADTPGAALAVVAAGEPFDLLITDVVMPEMHGPELVTRVRAQRPKLRILYMSGYTNHPIFAQRAPLRDAHFVQKPYQASELADTVRRILDQASDLDAAQ